MHATSPRPFSAALRRSWPLVASVLCAPLAAQSVRLNGPLAPSRGEVATFRTTPDGQTVVYTAEQDSPETELYRVAIDGGTSTRLNAPLAGALLDSDGLEISPDSAHVVYSTFSLSSFERDLFAVPLAGGPAVELDKGPDTDGRVADPGLAITTDGERVVYRVQASAGGQRLYSVPITGGTPVALTGPGSVSSFLLTPDSTQVVLLASLEVAGRFEVHRVPIDGGAPTVRLSPAPTRNGDASALALSPDGRWVVFASTLDSLRPVLYSVPIGGGAPLTLDPSSASGVTPIPFVTGDSARVLFQDGGSLNLFSAPIDGSAPAIQLNAEGQIHSFQLSPDGRWVVLLYSSSSVSARLQSIPAEGGAPVPLIAPGLTAAGTPLISPDGEHVLYKARRGTAEETGLFVVPITGGPSREIHPSIRPSGSVRIAPDGSRVAFVEENPEAGNFDTSFPILSAPIGGNQPATVLSETVAQFEFSADSRYLLLRGVLQPLSPRELFRIRANGAGHLVQLNGPLAEMPGLGGVTAFALQPDEESVVYQARELFAGSEQLFHVDSAGLARVRLDPEVRSGYATVWNFRQTADGERTLFVRSGSDGNALYSVLTEGGNARRLTPFFPTDSGIAHAPAPGGRFAAYLADQDVPGRHELYRIRLRGGSSVRLNAPLVAGGDVYSFRFAPQGTRIAYRADQEVDGRIELYSVLHDVGPASVVALSRPAPVDGFRFDPSGTRIVFRTSTRSLFRVPADGSTPAEEIRLPDGTSADVTGETYAIAPDGSRVVFPTRGALYSAPLAGGPAIEPGAAPDALEITSFALAPDASRVAFVARLTPDDSRLFTVPLAGGPPSEIVGDGAPGQVGFSSAGDRVLFTSRLGNPYGAGLFVAPAGGGQGVLLSGALSVQSFAVRADDLVAGFVSSSGDLYVTALDGQGSPQRVSELGTVVDRFVLGRERVFYLAAPYAQPLRNELFSRTYASLP